MPIAYRYDGFANRLSTRSEGVVTLSEISNHFRQLGRDARLRPRCDVMLVLSFPSRLPSAEQVDEVASIIEGMSDLVSFGRCAVVAPEDLAYGLGRMFQGFAWPSFSGVRVFRRESDATAWLDAEAERHAS